MIDDNPSPSQAPRKMSSIRSRMVFNFGLLFATIFAVVTLVSMFGIPFIPIRGSYGVERDRAMRNLDFVAGLKEERLQIWIGERAADMQMIAQQERIVRSTSIHINGSGYPQGVCCMYPPIRTEKVQIQTKLMEACLDIPDYPVFCVFRASPYA
ncbi:hypothetical protein IBX73_07335 [candidate division WOR-3 bacterium]|nr:hypothetical protein [candidate division WOR-3 bacterium]